MKKFFIFTFLLPILISCKSNEICGTYVVDDLVLNEESVKYLMAANVLVFNDDGTCQMPVFYEKNSKHNGTYTIDQSKKSIQIFVDYHFFAGIYTYDFVSNNKLVLIKENLQIKCSILFNCN